MNAVPAVGLQVQVAAESCDLPPDAEISRWAAAALGCAGLGAQRQMTVRLVDAGESSALNAHFRGREGPTNVLAFAGPGGETVPAADREFGDLVICLPLVLDEAAEQGKEFTAHLAHLVVHGTLHLAGFDHQDERGAAAMERLETKAMAALGYPDPYLQNS